MSVRVGDRHPGELQVLRKGRELCAYTIKICRNEGSFPKSQRWTLTQKIVSEATDAYSCIKRANATFVKNAIIPSEAYRYRYRQQMEAHAHLSALDALVDISYELNNIDSKRIEYWAGLIQETDRLLKAWMKSDQDSFRNIHNVKEEQSN